MGRAYGYDVGGALLLLGLVAGGFAMFWVKADARLYGITLSFWVEIGVFIAALLVVPYYLIRYRRLRRRRATVALVKIFCGILACQIVGRGALVLADVIWPIM